LGIENSKKPTSRSVQADGIKHLIVGRELYPAAINGISVTLLSVVKELWSQRKNLDKGPRSERCFFLIITLNLNTANKKLVTQEVS